MSKTKPCTLGPKHKWQWVENVTIRNVTMNSRGTRISISLRGLYKCECGADRIGKDNPNGHDLRQIEGGAA
jgi:hypothetical protein